MTEFDYDVMQRKRLARQAQYKKNGPKSRKCTLPHDHLTPAQLRKKNGEVICFNMNKPIRSWKEFRGLSRESAVEYIQKLGDQYRPSVGDLSRMFGCSYNAVKSYLTGIGAPLQSGRMPVEFRAAWDEFLKDPEEVAPEEAEPEEAPVEAVTEEEPEEAKTTVSEPPMHMKEFSIEFSGNISYAGIVNSLRCILGDAPSGSVKVTFRGTEST